MLFLDRIDAGQQLAKRLQAYHERPEVVVLGLPRGGVVVAAEIAREIKVPLDILVPRKIGAPGNPEFALGAITEEGEALFSEHINTYQIPEEYLTMAILKEKNEAKRRLETYRGDRPQLQLHGKTAILVDDGIATGATMQAAAHSARQKGAQKVIIAVPVLPADMVQIFAKLADDLVYIKAPKQFGAVGAFYEFFEPTEDEEVVELLSSTPGL